MHDLLLMQSFLQKYIMLIISMIKFVVLTFNLPLSFFPKENVASSDILKQTRIFMSSMKCKRNNEIKLCIA